MPVTEIRSPWLTKRRGDFCYADYSDTRRKRVESLWICASELEKRYSIPKRAQTQIRIVFTEKRSKWTTRLTLWRNANGLSLFRYVRINNGHIPVTLFPVFHELVSRANDAGLFNFYVEVR